MPFTSDREALQYLADTITRFELHDLDRESRQALDAVCCHLLGPDPALARLRAALAAFIPAMPPADAPCHVGIVPQSECAHCQRVAAAHAILQETAR